MVPYVRAANVKDGVLGIDDLLEMNFTPAEQDAYQLRIGDVLVTEGCGSPAELGASAQWRGAPAAVVCYQNHLLRLRAIPDVSDASYLTHLARWCQHTRRWLAVSSGTGILNIGQARAQTLVVPAPPMEVQQKIGAILSAYDDLIENNNRRIKLLEEMAQRIYREWFVDFRYPGHEDVPLVDSEMGPIPQGWRVADTGQLIAAGVIEIGDGYRAKSSEFGSPGLPFVRIRDLNDDFDFAGVDLLPFAALPAVGPKVSQPGDCVISTKGTVGRVICISDLTPRFVYSPQLSYWRVLDSTIAGAFLREWLGGPEFEEQCARVKGGTDMADYVNLKNQRHMLISLPAASIQQQFARLADPMFDETERLRLTRCTARTTRALLLPRLISGEIDVENLDVAVPDAAA
jgi:type I restriction enzyme S subunit